MSFSKRFFYNIASTCKLVYAWVGRHKSVMVFAVFLLLSTGFWFLNAMRKTYIATISFPIHFNNLPEQKVLVGDGAASALNMKVRATGFSLLRYNMSPHSWSLSFDVSKMKRFYKGDSRGVYIVTRDVESVISNQLSYDLELISLSPDTLFVNFYNKTKRKLPVRLNANINFSHPFYQSDAILLSPDSIEVSGPDFVMDTLTHINTQYQQFNLINKPITGNIPLIVDKSLIVSHNSVAVQIPCEAFTESSVVIPISIKGAPEGLLVKTFPSDVKISFRVALSRYETIRGNYFGAVVDVSGIDFRKQKRLKVKLDKVPDFVYAIDYNPLFVDFLLERSIIQR